MSWIRVAVASSGGDLIDQTLAQIANFYVYDVHLDGARLVSVRRIVKSTPSEDCHLKLPTPALEQLLDVIADCSVLLVHSLHMAADGKTQIAWLTVYEANMRVDKALDRLSKSKLVRSLLE